MESYTRKIREAAARLLEEGTVDVVFGFRPGTIPLMSQPTAINKSSEVERLHWDSTCAANLGKYLPKRRERIGVVAKGCDARTIVVLIQEQQITREQLYIIGVPCQGMVDRRQILAALDGKEILAAVETETELKLKGADFTETLDKQDYLQQNCAICTHRNPVVYDELVADPVVEQQEIDRYHDVTRIEALPGDQRWQYFQELVAPCLRCYACRNSCPMCYCPTCFVDESMPQWLGKAIDPSDTMTFHLLRAFHLAGRCTDCGNCERACPVGIQVRLFTKKLEKDVLERFQHETGLHVEERPPLDTYRPDDPEEFIR